MNESKRPKFFSISGFFQIARVNNLLVIVFAQYLTAIFLVEPVNIRSTLLDFQLFALVISTVLIAAAGYLINDYYDVKIDLINKPQKVVVGTVLQRRSVMLSHTLLNLIGIGIGAWIDLRIGAINFAAAFSLWLYSNQLKRTLIFGNLLVATLSGATVLIVGIYYQDFNMAIILYSSFAFTSNLVREIVKDIEDLQGDEKFGSNTLPIAIGVRRTKGVLLSINLIFALFILNLIVESTFPGPEFILYFFLVPIVLLSALLIRADKKKDFGTISSLLKWFMMLGILSITLINYTV